MTQVENYKEILESIFNQEVNFKDYTLENNCIGALNNHRNFHIFKENFITRLNRINKYFYNSAHVLSEIINTAKQIGQVRGYKWAGPYSELVVLDYWIQFENLTNIKYPDRGNVNEFANSIAKQIGQQEIDLDISLDLATKKIFTDVKSLIPIHIELIDNIIDKLNDRIKDKNYLIAIDNLFDVDYLRTKKDFVYELQSGTLIDKLEDCINNKKAFYRHTLKSGEMAEFRIAYPRPGLNTVVSTIRTLEPYKLAADYKYKILDYYNKLLIDAPSLITFVINPWFNQELNISFDFKNIFYRALSRRIFMELTKDSTDMGTIYPSLVGKNLRISDVAKKVTGIIFIYDNSVIKTGKDIYDVSIFLNPNSTNIRLTRSDFDILSWSYGVKGPFIDDFYYDNY